MIHDDQKSSKRKQIVLCIGDSITFGYGVMENRDTDSYPALLSNLLGDDFYVLNYGMNGLCALRTGRAPYNECPLYEDSLKVDADVCLILLGTNDAAEYNWEGAGPEGIHFKNDLKALVTSYQNMPSHPKVFLMTPPEALDISHCELFAQVSQNLDQFCRKLVQDVAIETGAYLIDLYPATKGRSDLLPDGIHPNKEGNEVLVRVIYEKLKEVLGL